MSFGRHRLKINIRLTTVLFNFFFVSSLLIMSLGAIICNIIFSGWGLYVFLFAYILSIVSLITYGLIRKYNRKYSTKNLIKEITE